MQPTGVARILAPNDIIVSKTDARGHLTYVNDTFLRFSAYEESQLIGKPHSIIRHPEMPRAVFHLLWETIGRGEELFAYIVNLAGDGAHYWVLAHVTPSTGPGGAVVGYHSNRRAPSGTALEQIRPLYQRLLDAERGHRNVREAALAGRQELDRVLAEAGTGYEELVWSLITGTRAA